MLVELLRLPSRFVGSFVGFTDSVVDVRFGSERCARQLVHMV